MSIWKITWAKRRKWGFYLTLFRCKYLCIKLLCFNCTAALSDQRHFKRSEFWIALRGSGAMICDHYKAGSGEVLIWPTYSIWRQIIPAFNPISKRYKQCHKAHFYVPKGSWHQFKNTWPTYKSNQVKAWFLEVQWGECSEGDIERR